VAGDRIQRTVTIVMGLQFGVQILGISLASLADRLGAVPLLLIQGAVMASGAIAMSRVQIDPFVQPAVRKHVLKEIREGLALVFGSERLLPIMLLTFAIGIFFAGAFTVLIPLTIRDIYHGGAQQIGFAYVLNMIGTVAVTLLLLARGGVARPGRAVLLAQGSGSLLFVPIAFGVPIEAFYALIFLWGVGGGVAMSMARSIVQEAAPMSHRARVMSVYSLGMMGGMPIGSFAMGYVIGAFGPANAALVPVIGMASVVVLVGLKSNLWTLVPHPATAQV
jgi:hypothetical protein